MQLHLRCLCSKVQHTRLCTWSHSTSWDVSSQKQPLSWDTWGQGPQKWPVVVGHKAAWPSGNYLEVSILTRRAGSRQVRFPDTLLHDGPSPGREVQFYAFLLHDVTSCGYGWRSGSGGTTHLETRTTPVFDRIGLFLLKHGSSRNKNSPRVAYKELLKEKTTNGVTQYPPSSALSKLKWHLSLQSLSSLDTFTRYFHQNVQYIESRRWLLTGISPRGLR